jgi:Choline/Carnitine o-acyltransferase
VYPFQWNPQQELDALAQETNGKSSWLAGFWSTMYQELRDPVPVNVNPGFVLKVDPQRINQVR